MEIKTQESQQPEGEVPKQEGRTIYTRRFMVDERAYAVSDWDIEEHNKAYLAGISGDYFLSLAHFYGDQLNGPGVRQAALALRQAYGQALETLLALLCATVQAPLCAVGWMLKYQNSDLRNVVRKIQDGQQVYTMLKIDPLTWESLAEKITIIYTGDKELDKRICKRYATLWTRLANEFLNPVLRKEYDGIKHSMRVTMTEGFNVRVPLNIIAGAPAPTEDSSVELRSDFGTRFYIAEDVDNGSTKLDAIPFRLREQMINWHPAKYLMLLQLIAPSIDNVANALRHFNNAPVIDPATKWPIDESFFDAAWFDYLDSTGEYSKLPVPDDAAREIPRTPKADVIAGYHMANTNYVPPDRGPADQISITFTASGPLPPSVFPPRPEGS